MTNQSYQQDGVEDIENPFEEEHPTALIIGTMYINGTHTRITTHCFCIV